MSENTESTPRLCSTCRWCAQYDYGYSNYTTEGTTLDCLRSLNPPLTGYEIPYGEGIADVLRVAEKCALYAEGHGPSFDVDGDITNENYKDDPETYALLIAKESQP